MRDAAGIPIGYHTTMPSRSSWLAYLLQRSITCLEAAGCKDQADALYRADADWIAHNTKAGGK